MFVITGSVINNLMKRIFIALILLFFVEWPMYAQPCDKGYAPCGPDNNCKPIIECKGGPPPPGLVLPIDSNIYILLAAGLGLGIYFFGFAGKKTSASANFSNFK